jgi:hypothetical protein
MAARVERASALAAKALMPDYIKKGAANLLTVTP